MPNRNQEITKKAAPRKATRRFFFAIGFTESFDLDTTLDVSPPSDPKLPIARVVPETRQSPGLRKAPASVVQLFPFKRVAGGR